MNFDTKLAKAGTIFCFQEDVFESLKIYNRGLRIMELILILTPTNVVQIIATVKIFERTTRILPERSDGRT